MMTYRDIRRRLCFKEGGPRNDDATRPHEELFIVSPFAVEGRFAFFAARPFRRTTGSATLPGSLRMVETRLAAEKIGHIRAIENSVVVAGELLNHVSIIQNVRRVLVGRGTRHSCGRTFGHSLLEPKYRLAFGPYSQLMIAVFSPNTRAETGGHRFCASRHGTLIVEFEVRGTETMTG